MLDYKANVEKCIILVCRPVVFSLLKLRSEKSTSQPPTPPSLTATGLIQVCSDSAIQAVNILDQLKKHNLLGGFSSSMYLIAYF